MVSYTAGPHFLIISVTDYLFRVMCRHSEFCSCYPQLYRYTTAEALVSGAFFVLDPFLILYHKSLYSTRPAFRLRVVSTSTPSFEEYLQLPALNALKKIKMTHLYVLMLLRTLLLLLLVLPMASASLYVSGHSIHFYLFTSFGVFTACVRSWFASQSNCSLPTPLGCNLIDDYLRNVRFYL